jgi:hypothetical protein
MRILIYGAGVIGCLNGALFSEEGYDVTILARGRRLENLSDKGLRYRSGSTVKTAKVNIIETLADNDRYDFVFVVSGLDVFGRRNRWRGIIIRSFRILTVYKTRYCYGKNGSAGAADLFTFVCGIKFRLPYSELDRLIICRVITPNIAF